MREFYWKKTGAAILLLLSDKTVECSLCSKMVSIPIIEIEMAAENLPQLDASSHFTEIFEEMMIALNSCCEEIQSPEDSLAEKLIEFEVTAEDIGMNFPASKTEAASECLPSQCTSECDTSSVTSECDRGLTETTINSQINSPKENETDIEAIVSSKLQDLIDLVSTTIPSGEVLNSSSDDGKENEKFCHDTDNNIRKIVTSRCKLTDVALSPLSSRFATIAKGISADVPVSDTLNFIAEGSNLKIQKVKQKGRKKLIEETCYSLESKSIVEQFMRKCFEGLCSASFTDDSNKVSCGSTNCKQRKIEIIGNSGKVLFSNKNLTNTNSVTEETENACALDVPENHGREIEQTASSDDLPVNECAETVIKATDSNFQPSDDVADNENYTEEQSCPTDVCVVPPSDVPDKTPQFETRNKISYPDNCEPSSSSNSLFVKSEYTVSITDLQKFICMVCFKFFCTKRKLGFHLLSHSCNNLPNNEMISSMVQFMSCSSIQDTNCNPLQAKEKSYCFTCKVCTKTFANNVVGYHHERSHYILFLIDPYRTVLKVNRYQLHEKNEKLKEMLRQYMQELGTSKLEINKAHCGYLSCQICHDVLKNVNHESWTEENFKGNLLRSGKRKQNSDAFLTINKKIKNETSDIFFCSVCNESFKVQYKEIHCQSHDLKIVAHKINVEDI